MPVKFKNSININDQYTLPTQDGSNGQALITDGSGNISFGPVSASDSEAVHLAVKNTSGTTITKGTPVYITGNVGNSDRLEIAEADASDAAKMPAVGLLESDLIDNGEGFVSQGGYLKGLATATIDGTSTTSNDTVYVKAGGGLTMTKPTGVNYIQNIAKVARVHATNGSLVVSSILRANDVPTPLYIDHTNQRLGIGTASPSYKLDIAASVANQKLFRLSHPTSPQDAGFNIGFNTDGTTNNNVVSLGVEYSSTEYDVFNIQRSTRNVGIGTTNPLFKLHVDSGTTDIAGYFKSSDNKAAILIADDDTNTYVSSENSKSSIGANSGAHVNNLNITSTGSVGIGTTSPYKKLTVSGDAAIEGLLQVSAAAPEVLLSASGGAVDSRILNDGAGNLIIGHGTNSATPTERFRIDSSGNVGIGTTSPESPLKISKTGTTLSGTSNSYGFSITPTSSGEVFLDAVTGSSGNTSATLRTYNNGTYTKFISNLSGNTTTFETAGTERMRIDSSGNVGIGTNSPSAKLEVDGGSDNLIATFSSTDDVAQIEIVDHDTSTFLGSKNGLSYISQTAGTPEDGLVLDSAGNVGIGTDSPGSKLHVSGGSTTIPALSTSHPFLISGPNNSGMSIISSTGNAGQVVFGDETDADSGRLRYDHSDNSMRFWTNADERMRIASSGNVGIGTSSPSAKLHVVGKHMITTGTNASPQTEDYLFIGGDGLASADASIYIGNRGNGTGYGWRMFYEGTGNGINNKLKFRSENLGSPVDVIAMTQDGNATFAGDVTVGGDLIVNGTTTTLNTTTVEVEDNILQLNTTQGTPDTATAATSGISVYRGDGVTQASLIFDDADDTWDLTNNLTVAGDILSTGDITIDNSTGDPFLKLKTTAQQYVIRIDQSDGEKFQIRDITNSLTPFTINAAGNVGIGTNSPDRDLHVKATSIVSAKLESTNQGHLFDLVNSNASPTYNGLRFSQGPYNKMAVTHIADGTTKGYVQVGNSWGAGSEILVVDGRTSRVGIGTSSPDQPLHVVGTRPLRLERSGVGEFEISIDNTVTGDSSDFVIEPVSGTNSAGFQVRTRNTAGSLIEALSVNHDGNVGIGTDSPERALHIDANGGRPIIQIDKGGQKIFNVGTGTSVNDDDNTILQLFDEGIEKIRLFTIGHSFFNGGHLGIGTTSPNYRFTAYGSSSDSEIVASFGSANDQNEYTAIGLSGFISANGATKAGLALKRTTLYGAGELHFLNNTTTDNSDMTLSDSKMMINSSGNVGIGTTSPNKQLQVRGDAPWIRIEEDSASSKRLDLWVDPSSAIAYVGANQSAQQLSFQTASSDRMRITNDGKVGIGTASPTRKLEVVGGSGDDVIALFKTSGAGTSDYSEVNIANNNNDRLIVGSIGSNYSNSSWAGMRYVYATTGDLGLKAISGTGNVRIYAGSSSAERMRITSSGNVGIGTTSPSAKLHIEGASTGYLQTIKNTTAGGDYLQMLAETGDAVFEFESGGTGGEATLNMYRDGAQYVRISADAGVNNYFNNGSNVGIGTNSPGSKLEVVGGASHGTGITQTRSGHPSLSLLNGGTNSVYLGIAPDGGSYNTFMQIVEDGTDINYLRFNTGAGTERMRIDSSGNIGIGTTSPRGKLDIVGNTDNDSDFLTIQDNDPSAGSHRPSIRFRSDTAQIGQIASLDNSMRFSVGTTEDSLLEIASGGNVGIGTTSPDTKLHIQDTGSTYVKIERTTSGSEGVLSIGAATNFSSIVSRDGSTGGKDLIFETAGSGSESMRIDSSGDVGIGTTSPGYPFHVYNETVDTVARFESGDTSAAISLKASDNTALFTTSGTDFLVKNDGSGNLRFFNNGSERMRIDSTGNVGIGTTSPSGLGNVTLELYEATDTQLVLRNAANFVTIFNGVTANDPASMFSNTGFKFATATDKNATGFSEKMRIDSSGNVGIGTTSPDMPLSTGINQNNQAIFGQDRVSGESTIYIGSEAASNKSLGITFDNDNVKAKFYIGGDKASNPLVIADGGNVGIGTDSPSQKLDVDGNVSLGKYSGSDFDKRIGLNDAAGAYGAGSSYIEFEELSGTGTASYNKGGNIRFYNHLFGGGTNETLTLLANGNVGIGTDSPSEKLHVDGNIELAADWQIGSNDGSYWQRIRTEDSAVITANAFNFETRNGSGDFLNHLTILNNGNVGIGTTSPTSTLQIDGQVLISATAPFLDFVDTNSFTDVNDRFRVRAGGNEGLIQWYDHSANSLSSIMTFQPNGNVIVPNGNVGIGTSSPAVSLDISATDAVQMPAGTTTERGNITSPANGMFRYNNTSNSFEGYINGNWGSIGGGGGSSTFYKDTFSGNGSTTGFTLTNSVSNENLTQIYINGVYQSKDNYSVSGTGITFTTAPPAGTNNIEVISVGSVSVSDEGTLSRDSFTGDGTTTQFTLSAAPTSEDMTYVFIQGVYQEKSTYSLSGSTLTFLTAPQNGYTFEVMSLTATNLSQTTYLANDNFTGTGSQTTFTLVNGTPTNKAFTMVFLSGVYQQKSTYSLTSGAIVFGTAPANNDTIEIVSIGNGGLIGTSINDANNAKYNVNVINSNTTASAGSVYVFTANLNLTLPANPTSGDSIKISNRSNVATCQLLRNGNRILGAASDLTLDTVGASFELIYSDTTNGWIIIGQ